MVHFKKFVATAENGLQENCAILRLALVLFGKATGRMCTACCVPLGEGRRRECQRCKRVSIFKMFSVVKRHIQPEENEKRRKLLPRRRIHANESYLCSARVSGLAQRKA